MRAINWIMGSALRFSLTAWLACVVISGIIAALVQ
jgi:hypothetical protein